MRMICLRANLQFNYDAALSLLKVSPFRGQSQVCYMDGRTDGRVDGRMASNAYSDWLISQVRSKTVTEATVNIAHGRLL